MNASGKVFDWIRGTDRKWQWQAGSVETGTREEKRWRRRMAVEAWQ